MDYDLFPKGTQRSWLDELRNQGIASKNESAQSIADRLHESMRESVKRTDLALEQFRQTYIKLRTDNIVLGHEAAIEMAKMIHTDAKRITAQDMQ